MNAKASIRKGFARIYLCSNLWRRTKHSHTHLDLVNDKAQWSYGNPKTRLICVDILVF